LSPGSPLSGKRPRTSMGPAFARYRMTRRSCKLPAPRSGRPAQTRARSPESRAQSRKTSQRGGLSRIAICMLTRNHTYQDRQLLTIPPLASERSPNELAYSGLAASGANSDVHPTSLLMCGGCGGSHKPVHGTCLRKSRAHQVPPPGSIVRGGDCEEVSFKEYAYLTWLLDSRHLHTQSTSLHLDDLRTTWFGVPHNQQDSPPKLFVWPRLQTLVNQASEQPHLCRMWLM